MANLRTDDRDTVHTAREANAMTGARTTQARSGGAGWIIALIVLVALAIAAWVYSGTGTDVTVQDNAAPRVTTEPTTTPPPAAPPATSETTAPSATEGTAPVESAPAPEGAAPAAPEPTETVPAPTIDQSAPGTTTTVPVQ